MEHEVIRTQRMDLWWLQPLIILFGLVTAIVYLTWAAVIGTHYEFGPYVSPVYSAPWIPAWWPISPAFLLLWIPIGFRATCYYARKMYYRAVFADPANCAIDESYRKEYLGETRSPFIFNNLHRYFLYLALILTVIHWIEWLGTLRHEGNWYIGVGTVIILIDTIALSLYVFSCHSFRHLIGGNRRVLSGGCCGGKCQEPPNNTGHDSEFRKKTSSRVTTWQKVSTLNVFHGLWFWVSLYSIIAADLYTRLLSMGLIPSDPHILL